MGRSVNYAVIDLGSNTVRLCVYDVPAVPEGKEAKASKAVSKSAAAGRQERPPARKFKTIMNRKTMAGLAAYVEDGALSQAGIDKAIDAVRKCLKRAAYLNPVRTDVFATAILRNISNSREAVAAVEGAAGCRIALLSAYDEAHLGFVGASSRASLSDGVLIDIGGGSSEVTLVEGGRDVACASLPQGSLSSYERFVADILPTVAEMDALRASVRELLASTPGASDDGEAEPDDADVAALRAARTPQLYGVGGSIRALAEVNARMVPGASDVDLSFADVRRLLGDVTATDGRRRAFLDALLAVAPERIHTISCGLGILAELFEEFGGQSLRVCSGGVREGYLLERMLADGRADARSGAKRK